MRISFFVRQAEMCTKYQFFDLFWWASPGPFKLYLLENWTETCFAQMETDTEFKPGIKRQPSRRAQAV